MRCQFPECNNDVEGGEQYCSLCRNKYYDVVEE